MLHGSSILASRREERVQKAALVDHHGPGDARLSHSAIGLYGEQSDYVGEAASGAASRARRHRVRHRGRGSIGDFGDYYYTCTTRRDYYYFYSYSYSYSYYYYHYYFYYYY